MLRTMMRAKIHRATVTGADLHYVGSVTIPTAVLAAADLLEGEKVDIVDVTNGARLSTYIIEGPNPGPGEAGQISINGAAAHHIHPGDIVIIIAYGQYDEAELAAYDPQVVFVDEHNHVIDQGDDPAAVPDGFGLVDPRTALSS